MLYLFSIILLITTSCSALDNERVPTSFQVTYLINIEEIATFSELVYHYKSSNTDIIMDISRAPLSIPLLRKYNFSELDLRNISFKSIDENEDIIARIISSVYMKIDPKNSIVDQDFINAFNHLDLSIEAKGSLLKSFENSGVDINIINALRSDTKLPNGLTHFINFSNSSFSRDNPL